jgi:photosystem II stability/assembly factor-like uncharacterized protein
VATDGTSVYSSDSPSRELLVGTADGIVTLERTQEPRGWRVGTRALKGSHISSMIIPQSDLMLAAIYHGGVMMSRDSGKSWERRDNGIAHNDVYSLGATMLNGRLRLFAGTEPVHFYLSDDLGANWRESPSLRAGAGVARWTFPGPPHEAHIKVITVAPDDPATVYASIEQGDLLRSTDAGETWQEISGFEEGFDFDVHRLVIMVCGTGLCVSDDCGKSWVRYSDTKSPIGISSRIYQGTPTYCSRRAHAAIHSPGCRPGSPARESDSAATGAAPGRSSVAACPRPSSGAPRSRR